MPFFVKENEVSLNRSAGSNISAEVISVVVETLQPEARRVSKIRVMPAFMLVILVSSLSRRLERNVAMVGYLVIKI